MCTGREWISEQIRSRLVLSLSNANLNARSSSSLFWATQLFLASPSSPRPYFCAPLWFRGRAYAYYTSEGTTGHVGLSPILQPSPLTLISTPTPPVAYFSFIMVGLTQFTFRDGVASTGGLYCCGTPAHTLAHTHARTRPHAVSPFLNTHRRSLSAQRTPAPRFVTHGGSFASAPCSWSHPLADGTTLKKNRSGTPFF